MKIKKELIVLENVKSNELSLVFSKIVFKGLCCDKVWGISTFSSWTPIRGIHRKSLLIFQYTINASEKGWIVIQSKIYFERKQPKPLIFFLNVL